MSYKVLGFLVLFFILPKLYSQADIFTIARSGTVKEIIEIADKNPNIFNSKNENGFTPLILACYKGNIDVAKYIIENSNSINIASDMGTPLMASVVKGNIEIAKLLLQKGANPDISDNNGITALIYATQFQNKAAIELLLKYNANKAIKDKEGKTAFEYATLNDNEEIINLLKN